MIGKSRLRLRPILAGTLALLASLLIATPTSAANPGRRSVELYRAGDFVSQANDVQCIGASMQMMMNMIGSKNDRSAGTQLALQRLARAASPKRYSSGVAVTRPRRGASAFGWAAALSRNGGGAYRVTSAPNLNAALVLGARAMASTGRPVGLLVWHGSHAWVMSGFAATADPLASRRALIRTVTVLDPWYPRYSSAHGASPRPGTRMTPRQLAADYLPWQRRRSSPLTGRYVLVIPYAPVPRSTLAPAPF